MENNIIIMNSTDMLSNLPDSIVHHILSFLDDKSLVRTSALSKQWKCTWIQGSTLLFKSSSFPSHSSFETYIHGVLSLRSPTNLHELSVIAYRESNLVEYNIIVDVVKYAFSRDVQHLEIHLENRCCYYQKPNCFFSDLFASTISQHRNLQFLSLTGFIIDTGFRSSCFETLKDLELRSCRVFTSEHDDDFDFFSGLPCLENLKLNCVYSSNVKDDRSKIFRVSGFRLRTLEFSFNELCSKIVINAPNLKSFFFHTYCRIVELTELNLPSLDYADILIEGETGYANEFIEHANHIITFFTRLGNVKSLMLRSPTRMTLRYISDSLSEEPSPFTRLETLILHNWDEEEDEDEDEYEGEEEVRDYDGDENEEEDDEEAMYYFIRGSNPVVMYE